MRGQAAGACSSVIGGGQMTMAAVVTRSGSVTISPPTRTKFARRCANALSSLMVIATRRCRTVLAESSGSSATHTTLCPPTCPRCVLWRRARVSRGAGGGGRARRVGGLRCPSSRPGPGRSGTSPPRRHPSLLGTPGVLRAVEGSRSRAAPTALSDPLNRPTRRAGSVREAAGWQVSDGFAAEQGFVGGAFDVGAAVEDLVALFGGVPLADLVHPHHPSVPPVR
jgi:hypothetical protein